MKEKLNDKLVLALVAIVALTIGPMCVLAIVFNLAPQVKVRTNELIFSTKHRPPPVPPDKAITD